MRIVTSDEALVILMLEVGYSEEASRALIGPVDNPWSRVYREGEAFTYIDVGEGLFVPQQVSPVSY